MAEKVRPQVLFCICNFPSSLTDTMQTLCPIWLHYPIIWVTVTPCTYNIWKSCSLFSLVRYALKAARRKSTLGKEAVWGGKTNQGNGCSALPLPLATFVVVVVVALNSLLPVFFFQKLFVKCWSTVTHILLKPITHRNSLHRLPGREEKNWSCKRKWGG